jgi:hypothetical protein
MWLPALGAGLFIVAAVFLFGTGAPASPPAKEGTRAGDVKAEAKPAASVAPAGPGQRKPDAKQMEEQLKMLQERFGKRGGPPPQAPSH